MRLIDADELRWTTLRDGFGRINTCIVFESDINAMPTVEAIPITLIEDWRKERVDELIKELVRICTEFESKLLEAEKKILETWEKENEENNL